MHDLHALGRSAIDRAIVSLAPPVELAALHGVSSDSIRRHARKHVPKTLLKASEIAAVTEADNLLQQAQRLQREALGVLEHAKADGNLGGVLQAIDRLQKGIALLGSLAEPREGDPQEAHHAFSWRSCPHHANDECSALPALRQ